MDIRLPLRRVRAGMFVRADVIELLVQGEFRQFLELHQATYAVESTKRLRLRDQRVEEVRAQGGLLVTAARQLEAFRETGVAEVVVDTERSDVVPDEAFAEDDSVVDELPPPPAPPPPVGIESSSRRSFGPNGKGWMKVEMSKDGSRASLRVLSFGGDASTTEEDVRRALREEFKISTGLEDAVVARLVQQAKAAPHRVIRGEFPVARRTRPAAAKIGSVTYPCLELVPNVARLPHDQLHRAWEVQSLDGLDAAELRARVVAPGELLAVFEPADDPDMPRSIYGTALPEAAALSLLRPGDNVSLSEGHYTAEVWGYVHLAGGEISVRSPVWVSEDGMEAHFVLLPAAGPRPPLAWADLAAVLEAGGVRYGIDPDALDELQGRDTIATARTLRIAVGMPPSPGGPGRIDWHYPGGAIAADAPVDDVEARRQADEVHAGQLLAEQHPPQLGAGGIDVGGRRVLGAQGEASPLEAGENVGREESDTDGIARFHATLDGAARVRDGQLRVRPVIVVDEDLGDGEHRFPAGHEIYVRGSIGGGAVVRAGGTIHVAGAVERGAVVHGQEDVRIERGVVGHATRVVGLGSVQARFVQGASVIARGDIDIDGHLLNAEVRAGRRLRLRGDGARDGSIVGGSALAAHGVEAHSVGSDAAETVVGVGPDPTVLAKLKKLDQGIDFCRTNILRIFRTLGMDDIDVTHFRQVIERQPPEKREPVIRILRQLRELVSTRESSLEQRRELEALQARLYREAEVRISGLIAAETKVVVGEQSQVLQQSLSGVVLRQGRNSVTWSDAPGP